MKAPRPATPARPALPRDPGLQPERTGLAWSRTAFVLLINAILIARTGLMRHELVVTVIGLGLLSASAGLYAYGSLCTHAIARVDAPVTPVSVIAMRLTTACVVAGAVTVLYLAYGDLAA